MKKTMMKVFAMLLVLVLALSGIAALAEETAAPTSARCV